MLISEDYKNLLRIEHRTSNWGETGILYKDQIIKYCADLNVSKILDYGSGQGLLKKELQKHNIDVTNYDPGIEEFSDEPGIHDIVVCLDVLEHVEYECLDHVLSHLNTLANRLIIFTICTTPAKRILSDGRNAHLIIKQINWWKQRIYKLINYSKVKIL